MKKLLVLLLAAALMLSVISVAAAETDPATLIPEAFGKVLPVPKDAGNVLAYDYNYYYGTLASGRIWKEYIPEGMKKYGNTIFLNVPEGMNTEEFLVKSGWIDVAEANTCNLFILEPVDGHWGSVDEEWDYLHQCFETRTTSVTSQEVYVVGYGEMGTMIQTYIARRAMRVAGAAFIDASDIDAVALKAIGDSAIWDLVQTAGGPSIIGKEDYKVQNKQVPLPIWIIDDNLEEAADAINYWKSVNKSAAEGEDFDGGKIFRQTEACYAADDDWQHIFTPFDLVADVAVLETKADIEDPALAKMIFDDFLCKHYRYTVNIWSSVLTAMPDYDEMGVEITYMTDEEGYKRPVLIYCPKEYKDAGPLPVVFTNPGGGGTVDFQFNGSAMYEIAEKEGFICVVINGIQAAEYTTGTSGRLTLADNEAAGYKDLHFVADIIEYLDANYSIDRTRLYWTGIFNFPWYVAQNMRDVFAAQATSMACNGMLPNADTVITDTIPVFLILGEYETTDRAWAIPGNSVNTMVMNRLNIDGGFGEVTPETVPEPEVLDNSADPRMVVVQWSNPETGKPVVRFGVQGNKAHAFFWMDVRDEWDFCKHWRLDLETKQHIYEP